MTQAAPLDHPAVDCVGVPIISCTRLEAARTVVRLADSTLTAGVDVHLCNAYTLAIADKDPAFRSMLEQATINFPDGKAVVWANRLVHRDRHLPNERVYGPDLFVDVVELGQAVGLRHYLLGATPNVLADLSSELSRRFPEARIVGTESPPFRRLNEREQSEQTARIVESGAHVVWVGLGTPKQDWAAAELATSAPVIFCAVGAAFDFIAGHKKQAPPWMRAHGLEWVHRLASEPRRLWRRYLFGNMRFIWAVTKAAGRLS